MTSASLPAAYCRICKTVFRFEPRDVFAGEVFCPGCSSRTEPTDRSETLQAAVAAHPHATVFPKDPVRRT